MKWEEMEDMKTDTKHAMEMIGGRLYKELPHITLIQEIIGNANDEFENQNVTNPIVTIDFNEDSDGYCIIFNNNAPPIPKQFFAEDYHTFFKSSKSSQSGGIGFVGVGAKQFLTSKDGRELITITGSEKDGILASIWKWREGQGVKVGMTPKLSLKGIIGTKKIHHTSGTTFIASLTLEEYQELKKDIIKILQWWWNYALLVNRFRIFVSGKEVMPWIPNEKKKYLKPFQIAGKKINCIFWITETELDEELQNIIWVVGDKRITNKKLETSTRIKSDYGKKIICYADVSAVLKPHVTMSKESFATPPFVSTIMRKVVEVFWEFVKEQDLLKPITNEMTRNVELEILMKKFNDALQSEKFKDLNPFLTKRTHVVPVVNENGIEKLSESDGFQRTGVQSITNGRGGIVGDQPGISHVFDQKGNESGERKIRQSRGFDIGEYDDPDDDKEADINTTEKRLLINTGHPFFRKHSEPLSLREFNKIRVIIDTLIRYQLEYGDRNAKTVLDQARDLLHEVS